MATRASLANNAATTLSAAISATGATTFSVASATGFPAVTTANGNYFYCTLVDSALVPEIVKVTDITGTTFTCVRAQDGTAARTFASGGTVSLRMVKAVVEEIKSTTREMLTAARTIYVNSAAAGGDTTGNGTSGAPYQTIQKGVDVASSLDLGLYDCTVSCAGSFTAGATLKRYSSGGGTIIIQGNTTTPSSVPIAQTAGLAVFSGDGFTYYQIQGFKISNSAGYGILANNQAVINLGNMEYGACLYDHTYALGGAVLGFIAGYTISGNATGHNNTASGGIINCGGLTIAIAGTPSITVFAIASRSGVTNVYSNTYTGTGVTGSKYSATSNGIVYGAGSTIPGPVTALPGSTAGSVATGGLYL